MHRLWRVRQGLCKGLYYTVKNKKDVQRTSFFYERYIMTLKTDNRLHSLDFIRGISLISMILFHTAWDLSYIYNVKILQTMGIYAYIWQQSICITFILLSGFCFSLSKNGLKRGITIFIAGGIVTAVTLIFMKQSAVVFGILTFIGSAMLICSLLRKSLSKLNPAVFLTISLLLFILTKDINKGNLGFYGLRFLNIPNIFYKNIFTSFLGFPDSSFSSTDYFSLFPWFFLFLSGYFLFMLFKKKEIKIPKGKNIPVVNFIGRHSLIIYLLHQPIIYGVLSLILAK